MSLLVSEPMHRSIEDKTLLINSGLFASGIATIIQSRNSGSSARMPVVMGATFVSVPPIIAVGLDPGRAALALFYQAAAVYSAKLEAVIWGKSCSPY